MRFSEHPPSKHWAVLKYRGERFADVWFKPEDDPHAVTFRIPQDSFHIPGMRDQLTIENLVRAVGISPDEVESVRPDLDVATPLAPPGEETGFLEVVVRMKQNADAPAMWEELESLWKAILGQEAAMDTLRISMESLLNEMEAAWRKPLSMDEKTYASRADVSQWNKARGRVHIAIPKMKEFIHRSVWAIGAPERKRLQELYDSHIQLRIPFTDIEEVKKQLEGLRKDRQVLSSQGKMVYQECRAICSEVQGALRTLQSGAANNARKKMRGKG